MVPKALALAAVLVLLPTLPAMAKEAAAPAPRQAYDALPVSSPASAVPAFSHIAIIVMENHSEAAIIGNPAAPFINSLASSYTYLDSYSAVAHPSLPNYLALTGGDTFGITSDCTRCYVPARSLADLLPAAGISGSA